MTLNSKISHYQQADKISFSGLSSAFGDDDDDFTAEQIAEFREVFNCFDKNKDGYINEIELGNAMRALGQNPTQNELNELLLSIQTSLNLLYSSTVDMTNYSNNTSTNKNTNNRSNAKNLSTKHSNSHSMQSMHRKTNPSMSISAVYPIFSDTDAYVGRIAKYKIDFSQFLIMMAHKMQNPDDIKEIRESFKIFDVDGLGIIDKERLIHAMVSVGEPLTRDEVVELLNKIDSNNDGKIDYEEFMAFMLANNDILF